MDLTEIKQASEKIYEGAIIDVERDAVSLPNGDITYREIVRHPGGACVCAMDGAMNVYFVRQFRYAYDAEVLELPAGKLDEGELPHIAARRELEEEAGLVTDEELLYLGEVYPSPGFTDEIIHLYAALGVTKKEQRLDEDEFVEVEMYDFVTAVEMVLKGEIKDAKSQICLLKTYLLLQSYQDQAGESGTEV